MDSPDVAMKPNNWLGNYPRLCIKTAHQQVKSMRAFRGTTPPKRCSRNACLTLGWGWGPAERAKPGDHYA